MILTRHLYNKEDVLKVFFQSILKNNKQRAMFWGFELYYSGFGEEVFQYIFQIYEKYFEVNNPKFRIFFDLIYEKWKSKKEYMTLIEKDRLLSVILLNIIRRNKNDSTKIKETFIRIPISSHRLYYHLGSSSLGKKSYQILQERCLYSINDMNWLNEYNSQFDCQAEDLTEYKNKLFYHWEYYAYLSPIWKERIQKYKGYPNHSTKKIEFLNDMYEEEFYEKYMYEPDENKIVQEQIIRK
jgi:hypothetical protein